jgi:hypothetical protein
MSSLYRDIYVSISTFTTALTVVGTVGNILSLLVCLRPNIRKTPTFIFIAFYRKIRKII